MFKRNGKYFWERDDDGTRDAVRRSVRESMQVDDREERIPADIDMDPGENPADVLIDALQADPDKISGDEVNELFARLDNAIYGVTRPAPVIKLVPRDDRG